MTNDWKENGMSSLNARTEVSNTGHKLHVENKKALLNQRQCSMFQSQEPAVHAATEIFCWLCMSDEIVNWELVPGTINGLWMVIWLLVGRNAPGTCHENRSQAKWIQYEERKCEWLIKHVMWTWIASCNSWAQEKNKETEMDECCEAWKHKWEHTHIQHFLALLQTETRKA